MDSNINIKLTWSDFSPNDADSVKKRERPVRSWSWPGPVDDQQCRAFF